MLRYATATIRLRPKWQKQSIYISPVKLFSSSNSPSNGVPENDKKKKFNGGYLQSFRKTMKVAVDSTLDAIFNPRQTWRFIKEVANHYWLGSKLLWSEIKIANQILRRVAVGHSMSRRERIQLIRTSTDIFRLVPFSIFVIVPFMEFLLPFALKVFPNMLPSTFQDTLKKEESMKQELQMRLAVAKFMQDALQEMANKKNSEDGDAKEVISFVEKARLGEPIPTDSVIKIARLFKDELTLANVARPQLVSMCQYMGLQPYGADSFLRFQLRSKLRAIQDDDRRILWDGIDGLNTLELREACRERGMRSIGMTQFKLKSQLQEWLDLSTLKHIPISLLIISRALQLTSSSGSSSTASSNVTGVAIGGNAATGAAPNLISSMSSGDSLAEQVVKSSMSSLDSDTINEVVLHAASRGGDVDTIDMRRRRLESLQFQKEMIDEEREEQEGAKAAQALLLLQQQQQQQHAANIAAALAAAAPKHPHQSQLHTETVEVEEDVSGKVKLMQDKVEEVVGDRLTTTTSLKPLSAVTNTNTAAVIQTDVAVSTSDATASSGKISVSVSEPIAASSTAVVAVANTLKEEKMVERLTVHELLALGDLARGSPLKREMSELAVLEAYLELLAPVPASAVTTTASSDIDGYAAAASTGLNDIRLTEGADAIGNKNVEEDASVQRVRAAFKTMVSTLKVKIDKTEKLLGDKLKLPDRKSAATTSTNNDNDMMISAAEIKEAVAKMLKKGAQGDVASVEESVDQLFQLLDSDKDGKVSIMELLQYIQKRKESVELEAMEAQMRIAKSAVTAPILPLSSSATNSNVN